MGCILNKESGFFAKNNYKGRSNKSNYSMYLCTKPVKLCEELSNSVASYTLIMYGIGELVQSIKRTSLIEKGCDLTVCTSICGFVGSLFPFLCKAVLQKMEEMKRT